MNHKQRKQLSSKEYRLHKRYRLLRSFDPINQGSRLFATPKPNTRNRRKGGILRAVGYGQPTRRYARAYDKLKAL